MVHDKAFKEVSKAILALFAPFSSVEQRVALTLYRLLGEGGPVQCADLAQASEIATSETEEMLARWPDVHWDSAGNILGYGGLTIAETKHAMQLGQSTRYTWCAWDTLFIPALLGVTANIESVCPGTGERVALTVRPDGVEIRGEPPSVSLVAPHPQKAADDIVGQFCCHVHFFASERAGSEWVGKHPGTLLATLDQAWQLGRRYNALRYPRIHA